MLAVKVIYANLGANPLFRGMFAQEVIAARKVRSNYTAPVVDADVNGPQPESTGRIRCLALLS